MQIHLNGAPKTLPDPISVAELLHNLGVPTASVVVELNRAILQPDNFATLLLKDNDQVEIIRFVGGG